MVLAQDEMRQRREGRAMSFAEPTDRERVSVRIGAVAVLESRTAGRSLLWALSARSFEAVCHRADNHLLQWGEFAFWWPTHNQHVPDSLQ